MNKVSKVLLVVSALIVIVGASLLANYVNTRPPVTPRPSASPSATPSPATPSPSMSPPHPSASPSLTPQPSSQMSPTPSATSSASPNPPVPPIPPIFPTPKPPVILYPGEVRQYQGENLSSISEVYMNAIAGIQTIDLTNYTLSVFGLVNNTLRLSYDDVVNGYTHYQKVVTIYCVEGWNATILWEGFLVKDLIQSANVSSGANTVIFHASDGYTTALPLNYLVDNNIIIASKMNGLVIPSERGFPFELVAESKYGYKWIKWITGIELSNDPNYLGFWESRGYPNDASIP